LKTWVPGRRHAHRSTDRDPLALRSAGRGQCLLCQRRGNPGEPVAAAAAATAPVDKTLLVRLAQHLKAGVYKVIWRLIAADTHKANGSFSFQVRP
jgi:CopC domain-containing protein